MLRDAASGELMTRTRSGGIQTVELVEGKRLETTVDHRSTPPEEASDELLAVLVAFLANTTESGSVASADDTGERMHKGRSRDCLMPSFRSRADRLRR